ncbi:MAG: CBS domain-containing protein [Streptosporangiaceae bacterium]
MTAPVVAVKPTASFKELVVMLRRHRVSALPVVDEDTKLIGIVSEADLLAKEALNGSHGGGMAGQLQHGEQQKADGVTAGDLMTRLTVTVTPDETVEQAARLMYHLRVKRLPVIDPSGYLVGILSRTDVLAVYDRPDEMILAEITGGVIQRELLIDPAVFTVTVADGVVTVQGSPETAELGRAFVEKIRQVLGVVDVHDELSYPAA